MCVFSVVCRKGPFVLLEVRAGERGREGEAGFWKMLDGWSGVEWSEVEWNGREDEEEG